jgi:hypothetical protein
MEHKIGKPQLNAGSIGLQLFINIDFYYKRDCLIKRFAPYSDTHTVKAL